MFSPQVIANPDAKTVQLWEQAISHISTGDTVNAEEIFFQLLTVTPDYYPSADVPPKILVPFQRARRRFFSRLSNSQGYLAQVSAAQVSNGYVSMVIDAQKNIISRATAITVHIRSKSQSCFRSITKTQPFDQNDNLAISFAFALKSLEHAEYYVEFIGSYGAAFHNIGSATHPLSLIAPGINLPMQPSDYANRHTFFKAGWPLVFSTALAVIGTLTYGLLKLK